MNAQPPEFHSHGQLAISITLHILTIPKVDDSRAWLGIHSAGSKCSMSPSLFVTLLSDMDLEIVRQNGLSLLLCTFYRRLE